MDGEPKAGSRSVFIHPPASRALGKGDLPPPFFLGAAACHGGVGGPIGPIASKEGRFYNRPGVVTQKAERDLDKNNDKLFRELEERLE